jgi:hypothetical protein
LGLFAFLIFVCRSPVNAFAVHEGAAVFFPFLAPSGDDKDRVRLVKGDSPDPVSLSGLN